MAFNLSISTEEKGTKKIIRCDGRVDAATSAQLETKLSKYFDQKGQLVLMDFSKVEYLSSAGLRLLLSATKKIKANGGKLVFCGMSDDVMEIIKMAGFERIMSIYPSEAEALAALGS